MQFNTTRIIWLNHVVENATKQDVYVDKDMYLSQAGHSTNLISAEDIISQSECIFRFVAYVVHSPAVWIVYWRSFLMLDKSHCMYPQMWETLAFLDKC